MKDSFDVSSSNLSLTMGSMGTISIGSQTGGASTKYDVQTPNAYEEVDDGGAVSISSNFVGNYLDNNALVYNSPSMDMMGMTVSADLEYTPKASGTSPNDGGVQTSATYGNAWGVGLTATGAGLTIGVYGSERENIDQVAATARDPRDAFTGVWYANYTMGPVSIGYSESYYDSGLVVSVEAVTAAKSPGVAGGIFESNTMSIAFNVNDNLSLSYAKGEDTYDAQQDNRDGTTAIADVEMDLKSIQAAYSMGAMSIKAYRTETDNAAYSTIGGSLTVTEVALGLAF